MRTLSLILYNLLLPVATLIMAPGAIMKMYRRGGRMRDFAQRLGFWSKDIKRAVRDLREDSELIWMHAVSVGEVGVARKLIQALLKADSRVNVVITSTTPTGLEQAKEAEKAHPGRVLAIYSPLDLPFVAGRVLQLLQPHEVVLVEAEVWPNLMAAAHRLEIPVVLINARLSDRSERRFKMWRALVAPTFAMLHRVGVQEEADRARWASIGVRPEAITLTGSVKYDPQGAEPAESQVEELRCVLHSVGFSAGRPLLLAASTHAGEERALGVIFLQLINEFPQLGFIVVPRHFERAAGIVAELEDLGLNLALRSRAGLESEAVDVLVVDSTGELKALQALADVVIIGKSFLTTGGQNPAEAVMAGKPVICGPHMENFKPLMELLRAAKGVIQVPSLGEVDVQVAQLLRDLPAAQATAARGREALLKHEGATQKTVELVLEKIP
jgi:3-deoxy-D-manno-octulosonic-acid transferase